MISVVSQKRMVVKTKQFSLLRWLVKKVWWLKQNRFRDCGWLVKKGWWLTQTLFRYCGG